jgi:hypothetical protein
VPCLIDRGLFPASLKNGTAFARLDFGISRKMNKNNTFLKKSTFNQNNEVTERRYLGTW